MWVFFFFQRKDSTTIRKMCVRVFERSNTAFDSEIAFAILLGPTDPCSIAVSMEPFSTLALKGLTWVFATTTKICTIGSSRQDHSLIPFNATNTTLLHVGTYQLYVQQYVPTAKYKFNTRAASIFRATRFGKWVVTHSLDDSDFHGHILAVFSGSHLLWDLMSVVSSYISPLLSATLTLLSVHPASPVLLTKNGPLSAQYIRLNMRHQLSMSHISPI